MNDPYNNNQNNQDQESLIQQSNGFFNSRYTAASTVANVNINNNFQNFNSSLQQIFHSNRIFVMSTLQSWGIKICNLMYSKDNQNVLKCILELIKIRQKDIQYKIQIKQRINATQFQKIKYQSLLKQSKITIEEKDKFIGRLENQNFQIKKKIKVIESQIKKDKVNDTKMINLLKSKNQQILHQIKKKQAQIIKIKEQTKKTIIGGSSAKVNQSVSYKESKQSKQITIKNTFQIIEKIENPNFNKSTKLKSSQKSYQLGNFSQDRMNFLIQKYEKQKKVFTNQNHILRNKVYQIRQILVQFAQYIDLQLFGIIDQKKVFQNKKFIVNHNLLFSENCLINDLNQVIQAAKDGISQLQNQLQKQIISKPSPKKGVSQKIIGTSLVNNQLSFKKKSISISNQNKNQGLLKSQKSIRLTNSIQTTPNEKLKQKKNQQIVKNSIAKVKINNSNIINYNSSNPNFHLNKNFPNHNKFDFQNNQLQISVIQNDLLSQIYDNQQIDDSILSHISPEEIQKQAQKYDKWDILFMKDQ